MAKRKSRKKNRIKAEVALISIVIILLACVICYFCVDEFKVKVDGYIQSIFGGQQQRQNLAKGESELRIHYLDVGQGDSIFIELPDDTVMLIDSGDRRNATAEYITNYISELGVTQIDYLMATHTDSDHIGNMKAVFDTFEIKRAYVPYVEDGVITANIYATFKTVLANETYTEDDGSKAYCEVEISDVGDLILSTNETDYFFIAFLSPYDKDRSDSEYKKLNSKPDAASKNGVSPIMLLEYMGKRALFTGDVTGDSTENVMADVQTYDGIFKNASGENIAVNLENIDLFKAAHHGSATHGSNSEAWINFLKPKYALICVGASNSYGLPDSEVLERLSAVNAKIYRTDLNGTVVATIYPDKDREINLYLTTQDENVVLTVTVTDIINDKQKNTAFAVFVKQIV